MMFRVVVAFDFTTAIRATGRVRFALRQSAASTPANLQVGVAYTRGEDLISYRKLN